MQRSTFGDVAGCINEEMVWAVPKENVFCRCATVVLAADRVIEHQRLMFPHLLRQRCAACRHPGMVDRQVA